MTVEKLYLVPLEGDDKNQHVEAQYNPKEIGVEKSATWSPAKTPTGNAPKLEFTAGSNRTMSLELTFDGYETGTDVHDTYVKKIVNMAMVMKEGGTKDDDKRPPRVSVVWGSNKLPTFTGVVESVSTKYTMFLPDGTPVRATVNVKLKEADKVGFKKGT